ncbi:type II toxin-antitoxin system RelB/DinJ family antitoxin [Negativibacillus massiliensis]|uniref:type II toxin-antitoxin system RelB/DinJ family antitoxin n=1 Tax=Negativibacillus massiliensis TaxID=1871035 RepID=UPI002060969A|nr:MAG TPA: addiction module antitoxin [Caudoviricetes sp.]
MAQTNINIRMDEQLKKQFDHLCNELGMNMTTAFNIFAKTMVRQQRIPFEVSLETPNAETREAIQEVQRMKADPKLGKSYSDVDQMMEDLLSNV